MDVDAADSDMHPENHRGSPDITMKVHKLSCEQCRRRKIRCNRVNPCSQCSDKMLRCTYPTGFKPRVRRQGVPVASEKYDKKLDEIMAKLDRISLKVNNFRSAPSSTPAASTNPFSLASHMPSSSHDTPSGLSSAESAGTSEEASESELDDDAPLDSQATFAINYLQQSMENHLTYVPPEVESSLVALKKIVGEKGDRATKPQEPVPRVGIGYNNLQLPPVQLGMLAIQKLKDTPLLELMSLVAFYNVGQFVDYFLCAYSAKPSLTDLIIASCGLHELFQQCSSLETNEALKKEFQSSRLMCRRKLETILVTLPFNLPCTTDTVLSLFLIACFHLERCQMSLAWNYLAAASQMSFRLGLHTDTSPKQVTQEVQKFRARLFWLIYMVDKMLSLRLSRPYVIRERDVSARLSRVEQFGKDSAFPVVPKWVRLAMLQGKVYDNIYAVGALREPQAVREARARSLAAELQNTFDQKDPIEESFFETLGERLGRSMQETYKSSDLVSHLSCLTLIYRSIQPNAASGSAFSDECLATAKQSLQQQQACLTLLKNSSPIFLDFYRQWVLLTWPFVPFVVVFCNAIETCDAVQLSDLTSVVETLEIMQSILPEAYTKQLRLFKLMHDVASKYISSRSSIQPAQALEHLPDTPFDLFFSQTGMHLPGHYVHTQPSSYNFQGDDIQAQEVQQPVNPDMAQSSTGGDQGSVDYGTLLGHWLNRNDQVFQMLEKDFD